MWQFWAIPWAAQLSEAIGSSLEPSVSTASFGSTKMYAEFLGPNGVEVADGFVAPMCMDDVKPELLQKLLEESHKIPIDKAAELFLDHCLICWKDVIPTIKLPTLVINGRISHVPYRSTEWIASVIPGAKLYVPGEGLWTPFYVPGEPRQIQCHSREFSGLIPAIWMRLRLERFLHAGKTPTDDPNDIYWDCAIIFQILLTQPIIIQSVEHAIHLGGPGLYS